MKSGRTFERHSEKIHDFFIYCSVHVEIFLFSSDKGKWVRVEPFFSLRALIVHIFGFFAVKYLVTYQVIDAYLIRWCAFFLWCSLLT